MLRSAQQPASGPAVIRAAPRAAAQLVRCRPKASLCAPARPFAPRPAARRRMATAAPAPAIAARGPVVVAAAAGVALDAPTASHAFARELAHATAAVELASVLCARVQARLGTADTVTKADESPVTVADYGSQALVSWALARQMKASGADTASLSMVAEEDSAALRRPEGAPRLAAVTAAVNDALAAAAAAGGPAAAALGLRQDAPVALTPDDVLAAIDRGASEGGPIGRHWVLDPIDGTKGFISGRQYAVALGLLQSGQAVLGVLGCPNLPWEAISAEGALEASGDAAAGRAKGCLFLAARGAGAAVRRLGGAGGPGGDVHCAMGAGAGAPLPPRFMESVEGVCGGPASHAASAAVAAALSVTAPPIRIDSQAKYGALSRGDATIYMRFPPKGYREKIWDHAAGAVVVTEAGGVVTDASGAPLDFSKGRLLDLDTAIVAAAQGTHARVLAAVQGLR